MTNSSEIFFRKLSGFAAELRARGLTVGLRETGDMLRVCEAVGFEDKELLRTSLRAILAGNPKEQQLFNESFDGYFVSREKFREREQKLAEAAAMEAEMRRTAEEELQFNGKPIDLNEELKDVYARMNREDRDKLLEYARRFKEAGERSPDLYDGFIRSIFMKSLLEQQMIMEDAAEHSEGADADILSMSITDFRDEDIPKAYAMIDRLTRQLSGEINARRRAEGRCPRPDFKRTIRAGLATGGTFPRICYKRKHRKKKRVIMLCDVSASMLQFSEFALRFMKSMSEISDHSNIYLFSETVRRVDPTALENLDTFANYVRKSGAWGKGTNIGRAIEFVDSVTPSVLDHSTVLLILSDAKTVDLPRAREALKNARRSAGSVIWMNPIPEKKWQYLKGINTLRQECRMVPCSTLNELARACARLV